MYIEMRKECLPQAATCDGDRWSAFEPNNDAMLGSFEAGAFVCYSQYKLLVAPSTRNALFHQSLPSNEVGWDVCSAGRSFSMT